MINLKLYEDMAVDDERRFYSSEIPVQSYEPLRNNFSILDFPGDIGKGIISLISFEKDDLIANLSGVVLVHQALHTLQISEYQYVLDSFAGFLTHSCSPNTELRFNPYSLYAVKKIEPATLLTLDYEKSEDYLTREFYCSCKSPNCKKYIVGKKAREEYDKEELENKKLLDKKI